MKRRDLLLVAGGAMASMAATALGQQTRRIGVLNLVSEAAFAHLPDYRRGLEETGYVEGRNLAIEYRYADNDYTRLPALAADLVRANVEVISSGSAAAVAAAMQATTTIPIVGSAVASYVEHFNRPEGNVTGVSIITGDLAAKRVQLLAELVPGATIGVLMNPSQPSHDRDRQRTEDAARILGVKVVFANASADAELEPAFAALAGQHVGSIMPEAEPYLGNNWRILVSLAATHRIPMMQEWRDAVAAGGLISYSPSLAWVDYQVGRYTGQILNGAKPADLPVIAPTKIELVINLKTAKALGLTVPQSLLARADEVIE